MYQPMANGNAANNQKKPGFKNVTSFILLLLLRIQVLHFYRILYALYDLGAYSSPSL
jgi:hypothetical protein